MTSKTGPAYRTWLEISEGALAHNLQVLQSFCDKKTTLIAVVKANAYGHGIEEIVRILLRHGVTHFGVDSIEEAERVRALSSSSTIVVLGYIPLFHLSRVLDLRVEPTLYDREHLDELERLATTRAQKVRIHLKVDTGTTRQGVPPEDVPRFIERIKLSPHLLCVGMSTHFSHAEHLARTNITIAQMRLFYDTVGSVADGLPDLTHVHCACSAAILAHPDTHATSIRPGLALYGLWPSEDVETLIRGKGESLHLKPVLSWRSRVAAVRDVLPGTAVGYGGREVVNRRTRIAVVPVGYYDGYDRLLSGHGQVLINGQRAKVLGTICMNMMMVDASDVANVALEDVVTLLGHDGAHVVSAADLAKKAQTIPWEILARISPVLPRIIV